MILTLILRFRYDASTKLGAIMRIELLCICVLRAASGPRVKLVDYKSALKPLVVYLTDRSRAVVLVMLLHCVVLW